MYIYGIFSKTHRSHENPAIQEAYITYLGEPNSNKAHDLLVSRERIPIEQLSN